MFKPEGVYPAMITPFDEDGAVNEDQLRKLVRWLIKEGASGLFPLGSVGEFIHLSFEEKSRVIKIIVDETEGRVPVMPGTAGSCVEECVRLTKKARDLGCQAAVIAPPYYYQLNQEMIKEHYVQVANGLPDFPILLYNIPMFATPLSYSTVEYLSRIKNIVGIKDSSGSMVDLLHYMDKVEKLKEFSVFTGREEMLLPVLVMGAKGTLSGTACVVPEVMTGIYRAWKQGELAQARDLQFSVLELIREIFALPFPLGWKAALKVRGFNMGRPKQPLSEVEQLNYLHGKSRIKKIMEQLLDGRVAVFDHERNKDPN